MHLIGPNGAGKTTLLNIISGYVGSDSGSIRLRGETIGGWTASRRVRQGMARTFQITQLFGHMTALENVMCGFHTHIAQSLASILLGLPLVLDRGTGVARPCPASSRDRRHQRLRK